MEEILLEIGKGSSWAALLIIAVRYLAKKLEKKDIEIARLNALLLANQKEETDKAREAEKEGIETMNDLNNTLKDLTTNMIRNGKK